MPPALYALYYFGLTLPRDSLGSGVQNFEGEDKKIARSFRSYAEGLWFRDIGEVYTQTGVRVVKIEKCPGAPTHDPQSLKYAVGGTEFSGEIRLHTLFGLPYGKVVHDCENRSRAHRLFSGSEGL